MPRTQAWVVGLNSRISRHAGTVTRMRQFSVLRLGCGAWVGAVFEAANGNWAAHMCNNNARLAGCREAAAAATVQLGSITLRPECAPVIAGEHACAHARILEILIDLGQHLVHQRLGWLRSEAGSCTGQWWLASERRLPQPGEQALPRGAGWCGHVSTYRHKHHHSILVLCPLHHT